MLLLYFRTIKHLRFIQIWYQIWYRLFHPRVKLNLLPSAPDEITLVGFEKQSNIQSDQYSLFGKAYTLDSGLWEIKDIPRLEAYHLHYFDFLSKSGFENSKAMIHSWLTAVTPGQDIAWDAYPISLRIVNWVKFMTEYGYTDPAMTASLYQQVEFLSRRMEYEILGNHLFKNILGLLFGAVYFGNKAWERRALNLLEDEIQEQTVEGGYHFEYSPTYHAIFTKDLLDAANILSSRPMGEVPKYLINIIPRALSYAQYFHDASGWLRINDCNFQDCPDKNELEIYGAALGFSIPDSTKSNLFPKLYTRSFSILMDSAAFGPDYMMGHAHADALQILMWDKGKPILIDSGNYDYEPTPRRRYSRSTAAHNTVEINGLDQAELWSVFRMGNRGEVQTLKMSESSMSAEYTGYQKKAGVRHQRVVSTIESGASEEKIVIRDHLTLSDQSTKIVRQYFHFHPDVNLLLDQSDNSMLVEGNLKFEFNSDSRVELVDTEYFPEMYVVQNKKTIIVSVEINRDDELVTTISRI